MSLRSVSARGALLLATLALFGCERSPDVIALEFRHDRHWLHGGAASDAVVGPPDAPLLPTDGKFVQGDLLVIEARPLIGDEEMDVDDACVTAISTAPAVAEVRPARGSSCRVFVVLAREPGRATVSFSARGANTVAEFDVAAVP